MARIPIAITLFICSATVAFALNCFNGRDACLREASEQYEKCLRRAAEQHQSGPTDAECTNNFQRSETYCRNC